MLRQPSIRPRLVFAGIVLVGVPSAFGIFPEMTRWSLPVRALITVAWVGVVAATLVIGGRRDAQVDRIVSTAARQREQLRLRATEDVLSALLGERPTGLPDTYSFTVYLFDEEAELLLPVFPEPATGPNDLRAFPPGLGATGMSYTRKSLFLVTGDAVADATYGLTEAQQQRWAGFRTVVSTPIWTEGERPKGVLSGISKVEDGFFDDPGAQARLREIADVIGVVLVNVASEG